MTTGFSRWANAAKPKRVPEGDQIHAAQSSLSITKSERSLNLGIWIAGRLNDSDVAAQLSTPRESKTFTLASS